MPDTIAFPKVSLPAPLQPEARLDQARMAHGPTSGRAIAQKAVGAPTNGRDSSHLENIPTTAAPKALAGIRSA
jgi:hypothetical protein